MTRFITRGALIAAVAAAAMLLPFSSMGGARSADAQAAGPTVLVGTGEPGYAVNLFGPSRITVASGTTVNFRNPWFEPHTVTFPGERPTPPPSDPTAPVPTHPGQTPAITGPAYVSSGFVLKDQVFRASFPTVGSFNFLCIIHPGMTGTVEVVAPGSASISTQAQLDAAAQAAFAPALAALKAAAAAETAKGVTRVANADGTSTFYITVGAFVPPSDVQQFFPPAVSIRANDTVVWRSSVPTPHTATFLGGTPMPVVMSLEDPKIFLPTPAAATGYNGVGYLNSGVIGLPFPSQQYVVKFNTAGSFPYLCLLHIDQGMGGVINVAAASGTLVPRPAATGLGGPIAEASGTPWAAQAFLVLAVAGLVAAGRRATDGRRP